MKKLILLFLVAVLSLQQLAAQQYFLPPSEQFRPDRFRKVVITESAIFVLTSIGLYFLWYKKYPKSKFHFLNDNREWLQMDKMGHATTAYNISTMQHDLLRWSGVKPNQAIVGSTLTSLAFLSIVEVMDGFSRDWGFSGGDMIANLSGIGLFAAQQKAWGQQRIGLKFSASFSPYAQYNHKQLGTKWAERLMKDYNGQTYWLSVNLRSFMKTESTFPVWLNAAAGIGADGMIGARQNPVEINGKTIPSFKRSRQFYLAADADLHRIRSTQALNAPLFSLQYFKMPAPAIEYNTNRKLTIKPIQF